MTRVQWRHPASDYVPIMPSLDELIDRVYPQQVFHRADLSNFLSNRAILTENVNRIDSMGLDRMQRQLHVFNAANTAANDTAVEDDLGIFGPTPKNLHSLGTPGLPSAVLKLKVIAPFMLL